MLPGLMVECLGWWPGQGFCPPRVINRTMIHFASLAHWEFLLAALGTARHKSQLTWQSLLPRAKNTIWYEVWYENLSKNDVILTYITRCRPSQSIKMSYNKHQFWTAIRPITIRKYWIRFQFSGRKTYLCGLILRSRGRKPVRYPWDITTRIIDTSEEWDT